MSRIELRSSARYTPEKCRYAALSLATRGCACRAAFLFAADSSCRNPRPPRSPSSIAIVATPCTASRRAGPCPSLPLHPAPHPALQPLTQLRARLLLIAGRRTQGNGGNDEKHRRLSRNIKRRDSESRDPVSSKADEVNMTFDEYRELFRASRGFQRYSSEQRANHASSHRLTQNQRISVGEYFYAHVHAPGIAFPTRQAAERAGYDAYLLSLKTESSCAAGEGSAPAQPKAPPIHLTHTGPAAGTTLCGARRDGGTAHHAVYAPVQRDDYRALCCAACLKEFARAWAGARTKPDWVTSLLAADTHEVASTQLALSL